MADSAVVVSAGVGTNIDTRTEDVNANHRQVVVLGDPVANVGVCPVDGTAGLKVNLGADNDVVLGAGELHIGQVGAHSVVLDVTLSLDTSAYADGDVLADTQTITSAFRVTDGTGVIQSLQVLDEDDQGMGMDIIFLDAANSLGTENSAPSITDANARNILGRVSVISGDYIDLGGVRHACKTGLGLVVKALSGANTLAVAAISRGTGTYTASGVRLRIGLLQD